MNGQNPNNNQTNNLDNGLNGSVLGTSNQVPNQVVPPLENNLQGTAPQMMSNSVNSANPSQIPNSSENPTLNPQVMPNTNINNTPNPEPVVQAQPVQTEPVARPIPGTEGTAGLDGLTGSTASLNTPLMNQNKDANSFIAGQKNENIGSVPPPVNNDSGKKKPMNKFLFIILIIALIALVAYGVYYFLSVSSSKVKLTLKNVTIGVGEPVSDKITDYAIITRGDPSSCTLNPEKIKADTIGQYEFTITCGKDVYTGKVNVSDVTAPEVSLNIVFKSINSNVTIDDFVESCTDPSNCTTTFVNEATVSNYLTSAGGPYTIEIKASDTAGNEKITDGILYVTPYEIKAFTKCSSSSTAVNGYQATKITTDMLPIGHDGANMVYLGVARRIYTYEFANKTEYQSVIGNKEETITFDGVSGLATYDDELNTLTISSDLSSDTLNTEANGTFPTNYADFLKLYTTDKGYSCSNSAYTTNQ